MKCQGYVAQNSWFNGAFDLYLKVILHIHSEITSGMEPEDGLTKSILTYWHWQIKHPANVPFITALSYFIYIKDVYFYIKGLYRRV